jgi:hypothetical protein
MKLKVECRTVGFHLMSMFVAMLLLVGVANAAPVTYNVNRTIAAGSVKGTIQTDGTVGVLTAANVIDWNLTLNDGTNTFVLTGPASGNNSHVFITGSDVTATAASLSFNFSGVDSGYFLFQVSFGSGLHYYCDATSAGVCSAGERVVPQTLATSQLITPSGTAIIGTGGAAPSSGPLLIPTLSDWGLVALALLLFGTTLWIRSKPGTLSMRGPSLVDRSSARRRKAD